MQKTPYLLTPGPLTVSMTTKRAMLQDWGSWDSDFHQIVGRVRKSLVDIIGGQADYDAVLMQGCGSMSVEAAIGSLMPRDGLALIPNNGAYCSRIEKICTYLGRAYISMPFAQDEILSPKKIEKAFIANPNITHLLLVHCETSAGILNPIEQIAQLCQQYKKSLIIDAMSSFAALPTPATLGYDALIAASGKCLEGVPGLGFVLAKKSVLEKSKGNAHSLALDLYDQWEYFNKTNQFRFTPPTHVIAALDSAIGQFEQQGGQPARLKKYQKNCTRLVNGMKKLGFKPFLAKKIQAPIIVTFHAPIDGKYEFRKFYEAVKKHGYILYPGKLTDQESFRVGCMGELGKSGTGGFVRAVERALQDLGITQI